MLPMGAHFDLKVKTSIAKNICIIDFPKFIKNLNLEHFNPPRHGQIDIRVFEKYA